MTLFLCSSSCAAADTDEFDEMFDEYTPRVETVRKELGQHLADSGIVAVYYFIGHGSKNQIKERDEVAKELDNIATELNAVRDCPEMHGGTNDPLFEIGFAQL